MTDSDLVDIPLGDHKQVASDDGGHRSGSSDRSERRMGYEQLSIKTVLVLLTAGCLGLTVATWYGIVVLQPDQSTGQSTGQSTSQSTDQLADRLAAVVMLIQIDSCLVLTLAITELLVHVATSNSLSCLWQLQDVSFGCLLLWLWRLLLSISILVMTIFSIVASMVVSLFARVDSSSYFFLVLVSTAIALIYLVVSGWVITVMSCCAYSRSSTDNHSQTDKTLVVSQPQAVAGPNHSTHFTHFIHSTNFNNFNNV